MTKTNVHVLGYINVDTHDREAFSEKQGTKIK